jgi:FKBP-type peptidyl-prolyl cis-trans isomerase SlpA
MNETVKEHSLLTLHYRLATADDTELVSTFGAKPATLQLGSGELAPVLERHLVGLPVGQRTVFLLESDQAFGPHNPQLMQRFARSELPNNGELRELALIEFKTPGRRCLHRPGARAD